MMGRFSTCARFEVDRRRPEGLGIGAEEMVFKVDWGLGAMVADVTGFKVEALKADVIDASPVSLCVSLIGNRWEVHSIASARRPSFGL